MQKTLPLMLLVLLGCRVNAHAQKGENLYVAPGMPVITARRMPVEVAAATKPWLTQPLPRFWKNADSMRRQQGSAQLRQAIAQRQRYLKLALLSQLGGSVKVRIVVGPGGAPLIINIIESVFAFDAPAKKAGEALQAEALRITQLLRFQPAAKLMDTLVVPISYRYE